MAGLDDEWETIDLQPNPAQRREHSFLDYGDLSCMTLNLDAPLTGFPWHASACSDVSRFHELGATTLVQRALDPDLDDEEMNEGEGVLNF